MSLYLLRRGSVSPRAPVLGVDGQARSILEGARGGLVIEPENSDALMNALCCLATNPELARKMGRHGREYIVRKFSRSQTAEKYIQVLEHMSKLPDRRKLAA